MARHQIGCLSAGISLLFIAAGAVGHHSNDYHFDRNVDVTVSGTVNRFRFINPHSRLLVDVTNDDGEVVTWDCEMSAANGLRSNGWTDDVFRPGEEIVIQGFAARHSDTECYFDYAELGDGRRITMADRFDETSSVRPEPTAMAEEP